MHNTSIALTPSYSLVSEMQSLLSQYPVLRERGTFLGHRFPCDCVSEYDPG